MITNEIKSVKNKHYLTLDKQIGSMFEISLVSIRHPELAMNAILKLIWVRVHSDSPNDIAADVLTKV